MKKLEINLTTNLTTNLTSQTGQTGQTGTKARKLKRFIVLHNLSIDRLNNGRGKSSNRFDVKYSQLYL